MDALTSWVGKIPTDVVAQMAEIAPMLRVLGYDPNANPPNYGTADEIVIRKTEEMHKNSAKWHQKAVDAVNDPSRVDLMAPVPDVAVVT